jgi:hypothetical protein
MDEVLQQTLVEPLPRRIAPEAVVTEVVDAGDSRTH